MKSAYIKSIAFVGAALMLTACNDNTWNDLYIDNFEPDISYDNPVTVQYDLTKEDYESIGATLYNKSTTQEEKDAANSIRNNYYFDQSSCYPLEVAVPIILNKENTNFEVYNPGSKVQVALAVAQGVPEEISKISGSPRLVFPKVPSNQQIISKLSQTYPDAEEGKYVRISYNPESVSSTRSYSSGQFIYTPKVASRASSVWTVAEALSQMKDGYEGEAIVKGIISEIQEISTSYGNATYFIKDALSDTESLEVFRGYGYNGEKFTSETDLQVGQAVIVSGELKNYNGTLEFTTGSKLITESDIPGGDTPGGDTPGGDTPGGNTPGGNQPGGDNPGGNTPGAGMNTLTSNIKDLSAGMELSATAMVTAVSWSGLVLSDKAGSIYYYNNQLVTNDYPVGTVVRVKGTVSEYNSSYQLTNTATLMAVGEGSYIYPTPKEYDGNMIDEACASTSIVDPTYVTVKGIATKGNNSVLISIEGASAGVVFYPTADLFDKIVSGDYYSVTGYYIHTTTTTGTPSKLFNVVATDVKATTYPVDEETAVNVIYTFNGTTWEKAGNAAVVNGSAYSQMGFAMNNLTEPSLYLPNYMKQAFPYALKDTEMFVAYNQTANGCACSLLLFDGSEWTVNDNYLENKVAEFSKTNDGYQFRKYIGEEVFYLFDQEEIAMNCGYLFVWGNYCANPVDNGSRNYGYLYTTDIEINTEDNSIVMPSGYNTFTFVTTTEYQGNVYTAPEGMFMIVDSEGRYMSCGEETYYTFYIRSDNAYINSDGTIAAEYLFWATKNEDGSWKIDCEYDKGGKHIFRSIYYAESSSYKNFAVYTPAQAESHTAYYPMLYISAEDMPESTTPPTEE